MSKKKVSSTMSLKDFHGGSIPSDLPLPSAPGVVARPGSDRTPSANWGNNLMRTDLRPRPKSSGASRGFDEKASLLSHPSPIGRNFDEDERKPLDGLSAPRRTISDESIQRSAAVVHHEVRLDCPSSARVHDRPLSSPGIQSPSLGTGLRSVAGSSGIDQAVNNSKVSGVYNGQGVNSNPPNAWGVKKEVSEYVPPSPLGTNPISKLAQASAIDKVSSGMWQSKNPTNLLPHLLYAKDSIGTQGGGAIERSDYDAPHGIQTETDLLTEDRSRGFGREYPSYGINQTPRPREDGNLLPQTVLPGGSDQVKPKPYQRSISLEASEVEYVQVYHHATQPGLAEMVHGLHEEASSPKSGPAGGNPNTRPAEKPVERPKLNLKPRSQPLEQSEGNAARERNSLFGGARPRELVLKERGVDDIEINKIDQLSPSTKRVNSMKIEVKSEQSGPAARQGPTKGEVRTPTNRGRTGGREFERKDHPKVDHNEKPEQERKSWRNDKWKSSNKEMVVNHNNNKEEQRPEPETWRKPIDDRNSSTSSEGAGHGKLVSALELAQAFSKSVSVSKNNKELLCSPHRGGLVRQQNDKNGSQVLFSRLTETRTELYPAPSTARHRVNGVIR